MLPDSIYLYNRFAFFNELMHKIEINFLKSAQVLLLLPKNQFIEVIKSHQIS